jgi:predicted ribosomally synthesized peptide with nif11-like leader
MMNAPPDQPAAGTAAAIGGAKEFFDRCDTDPVLRQAVMTTNQTIVALAASHGFAFTYADMQSHLRDRWDVKNAPEDFCCT